MFTTSTKSFCATLLLFAVGFDCPQPSQAALTNSTFSATDCHSARLLMASWSTSLGALAKAVTDDKYVAGLPPLVVGDPTLASAIERLKADRQKLLLPLEEYANATKDAYDLVVKDCGPEK